MSAPPWTWQKIRGCLLQFRSGLSINGLFLAGSKGGAHLTVGLWGQANNRWHGMGMGAPDMRRGAKPYPDSHSRAEVGFFLEMSAFFFLYFFF